MVLFQLPLAVCSGEMLTLRPRSQVAVAVDVVKVFGNRVLVVVAVGTELWTVGTVDILQAEGQNIRKTKLTANPQPHIRAAQTQNKEVHLEQKH